MDTHHLINKYLDKIEFAKKTKLLISIISFGMILISFFMLISIFALKYDYETLYQKRTTPQVELGEIKDLYTVNIYDTLYDIKEQNIDTDNALEVISLAKQIIKTQWKNYNKSVEYKIAGFSEFASNWLNFFLFSEPLPKQNIYQKNIVSKVKNKMHSIDLQTLKLVSLIEQQKNLEITKTINNLFLEITSINIYISSLISSHLKKAIVEKRRNDRIFRTSTFMLIVIIGFIFFLSFIISFIIINHFRELHNSLEVKVNLKTKELLNLNDSLEKRIKSEVINNRKKDQIMFAQAKLASLGEMLQNIAHQWRQPLGTLTMIIQSFQAKFLAGKLTEEFIDSRVEDAGVVSKNMSDTLEDFRTFFDPNKTYKNFSVKKAIEKSIDLTKYQLEKEGVIVDFNMSKDIKIYSFENELTHVILNLINNSKDALLGTKTKNKKIMIIVKETLKNVIINVIDNAGGIKSDIMTKVFDPYFTTKHKSIGTGIGLYMSKQMIEKHMNGKIYCKNMQHKMATQTSELYECAMFTIEIPKKLEEK